MQLIDTHCHIDFPVFDTDRADVLAAARAVGVTDIIVPGVVAKNWPRLLGLVANKPGLHAALGLHPCFMSQHQPDDLDQLATLIAKNTLCAVGEIGLDLFIPNADLEQQLQYLRPQLQLAKQHSLPVILHVRKAHDQMLKELRLLNSEAGGVVHAFSGSEQQAEQYLKLGYKLGIGGTLTYDRAKKLHRIVKNNPIDSFVLETDAPDIPLANYRGEVNRPERVLQVAEVMAEIKECSLQEVAIATSENAQKCFRTLC